MLTRLRDALYRTITTRRGDSIAPIRIPKELARRLNQTLGQPLATRDELAKRRRARARLAELRAHSEGPSGVAPGGGMAAPILVYFEKDRNVRELQRIEELLGAQKLDWKRLDVTGDEATIDFVLRQAKCERDELPIVFVADRVVGNHAALVRAHASGELMLLLGAAAQPHRLGDQP
jgi:hypothetical protein